MDLLGEQEAARLRALPAPADVDDEDDDEDDMEEPDEPAE